MSDQSLQTGAGIQKVEFRAMGSYMLAAVESDDPAAQFLLAEVSHWFEEWEQVLSRFRSDSELVRLNKSSSSSTPVAVSETLWDVLQAALSAADYTDGLVSPALLDALEAAGYTTGFNEMKRASASPQAAVAPLLPPSAALPTYARLWRNIATDSVARTVTLPQGVRLDFGGIAKGWAADQAVARLAQYGPALVDAGGDIAVSGPLSHGDGWPIGIDAPSYEGGTASSEPLGILSISSGGVATSGRDYRRWLQGGKWQHHIIDPRTGSPADTDLLAVTVVAPTACMAETAAKTALILGSAAALAWLEARPTLAAMLILEDGNVLQTSRLNDHLWSDKNGK